MKVAIYARVSTKNHGQDTENQLRLLRELCEREGHKVFREYVDQASGGTGDRPAFRRMFEDATKHKFDLVLFWSLDRFSREGVLATLQYLERLTNLGINYRSISETYLDSCGVFRDAIISIMATLAKQERIRLSERVQAGLDRVRETGTRSGRPLGRPRNSFDVEEARRMKADGRSWREIGQALGVPVSTLRERLAS